MPLAYNSPIKRKGVKCSGDDCTTIIIREEQNNTDLCCKCVDDYIYRHHRRFWRSSDEDMFEVAYEETMEDFDSTHTLEEQVEHYRTAIYDTNRWYGERPLTTFIRKSRLLRLKDKCILFKKTDEFPPDVVGLIVSFLFKSPYKY